MDVLKDGVTRKPLSFDGIQSIDIEKFISDVLPRVTSMEAYVEPSHKPNFVSLIAPVNPDSKNMFKWNNNFTWANTGNLTDSSIKENVKLRGGNITGILMIIIFLHLLKN